MFDSRTGLRELAQLIAERLGLIVSKTEIALKLLVQGYSPFYIGRYRRHETGGLTCEQVYQIFELQGRLRAIQDRMRSMLKNIESQGELTEEVKKRFLRTFDPTELEDLYEGYRVRRKWDEEKRKLFPYAQFALRGGSFSELCQKASDELNLNRQAIDEKLREFLQELIALNPDTRKALREETLNHGSIKASLFEDVDATKLSRYYSYREFNEPIKEIPSHRILALLRGVKEHCLGLEIELEPARVISVIKSSLGFSDTMPLHLLEAIVKSYENLLKPLMQESVLSILRRQAEREAIEVFAGNLKSLLMEPPAGRVRALGVDPGYRTGCKMAAVDEDGQPVEFLVVYPHKPLAKIEEARRRTLELLHNHRVEYVAIENGTAARETGVFFRELLKDVPIKVVMLSECGSRDYALSKIGKEELPDLPPEARSAVSIARRFQDPLYELVKVDPKSIGVGHYQHEVNQQALRRRLRMVIQECVCEVGVDLNRASRVLLSFVPGISKGVARKIVEHRNKISRFERREQLLDVDGFGERLFEEASPFLRIKDGTNPLDATAVHPNYYPTVEKIASDLKASVAELIGNPKLIEKIPFEKYVTERISSGILDRLKQELLSGTIDPRGEFHSPEIGQGITAIEDLESGMILEGVVTNVTNFGAFVDVGIHEDGLLHVSELSEKFVRHPSEVVKVGDIIRVRVISVDRERRRVGLSMKNVPKAEPTVKKATASDIAHLIRQYSS